MTPEEYSSECFDEPELENSREVFADREDSRAWAAIASHLKNHEVIAIPADFRDGVRRAIARARTRRDLALLAQVGVVTGVIATAVVALGLGFDWWSRILAFLEPGPAFALMDAAVAAAGAGLAVVSLVVSGSKALWLLLPLALFVAAVFTALAELAVFRVLRTGPFAEKSPRDRVASHLL